MHHKRIIISDIHLGNPNAQAKKLLAFLNLHTADQYILNGDIIDGWSLKRGSRWKKSHTKVVKKFIELSKTHDVIYIRGNHDDFLDQYVPMKFGEIKILSEFKFHDQIQYLVVHGDLFDSVTTNAPWIAKLGGFLYDQLLLINRLLKKFGLKKSFSRWIKHKVKMSVNHMSSFERHLAEHTIENGCGAIICGHIHHPSIQTINGVLYMNSGDWVESCSALIQEFDGTWNIFHDHHV